MKDRLPVELQFTFRMIKIKLILIPNIAEPYLLGSARIYVKWRNSKKLPYTITIGITANNKHLRNAANVSLA